VKYFLFVSSSNLRKSEVILIVSR